jgi:FAD-dependent urate hydroxylase
MRAVVVGAGIGGMSTAIALTRIGWDVDVYEQVRENRPVGAAISVWSNGVKAMNYLGLGDRIAEIGGRLEAMAYRWLDGRTMCDFSLAPVTQAVGQRPYPVARAELQAMLMDAWGRDRICFGKRMIAVESEAGGARVTFDDETTAMGDIVVAADGARSLGRDYVLGRTLSRRYAGYVNFNTLVPIDEAVAAPEHWTTYVGEGKRVSVMPVAGNRFYTFFDVPLPAGLDYDRASAKGVLSEHFGHWAVPVQRLIGQLDPDRVNRVEIFDIDPFDTWVRGRVVLLGDAAHNTTPDIGQGGCLAMEDAVVLAISLQTNTLGVEDALHRYEAARTGRAADLVLRARKRCDVTHAADPAATQAWYDELWTEDGGRVLGGIIANIVGNPLGPAG